MCGFFLMILFFGKKEMRDIFSPSHRKLKVDSIQGPNMLLSRIGFNVSDGAAATSIRMKDQSCVQPKMELWQPQIKAIMQGPVKKLACSEVEKDWVYIGNSSIYIDIGAIQRHGKIVCDYMPLTRLSDYDVKADASGTIKNFQNGTRLPADFIVVNCTGSDGSVYKNSHSGVLPNDSDSAPELPDDALGLNVLTIGFDSLSRLMWQRNLPVTYKYITESLGAVVMNGYNVVGDGTTHQLLALLTGKPERELPVARRGHNDAKPVDVFPFIWKDFKKLGYATQWAEDEPGVGTLQYRLVGFEGQPVDHYMRLFYLHRYKGLEKVDKEHCFGSLSTHENMFKWGRDMFESYKNRPKWSFIYHSELSHNNIKRVTVVDEDLTKSLKYMNEKGYFDNTLLIFMSDHGSRFSNVRKILQGKYEERNPFIAVRLPPKLIEKYPEIHRNLKINAKRLCTPFDVHATFHDVLSFTGVAKVEANSSRGISFFQEIPADRTCDNAGVEAHWCSCLKWTNVQVKDPQVTAAAQAFVQHVNTLTSGEKDLCEVLSLHHINRAEKYTPNEALLKFGGTNVNYGSWPIPLMSDKMKAKEIMYQIQLTTTPGMGLFESTIRYNIAEKKYQVKSDEISRVNMYADQPHCIATDQPSLRPYCYCKIQL